MVSARLQAAEPTDYGQRAGELFGRLFGSKEAVKFEVTFNLRYDAETSDTMPFIRFARSASVVSNGPEYVRGGSQTLVIGWLGSSFENPPSRSLAGGETDTILL
jgi:hypothetical protein